MSTRQLIHSGLTIVTIFIVFCIGATKNSVGCILDKKIAFHKNILIEMAKQRHVFESPRVQKVFGIRRITYTASRLTG